MVDSSTFTTLVFAAVATIGWGIRQEGRINGHDKLFEEREKLAESRLEEAQERHADMKAQLVRMESKLDRIAERN